MPDQSEVAAVLTTRSVAQILAEGGLSGFTIDLAKVRRCRFLVCIRSSRAPDADREHASGSAFLVGRISDAVRIEAKDGQSFVRFNEVSRLEVPFAWKGGTHPVHYTSFQELGIVVSELRFEDVPALGRLAFPGEAADNLLSTGQTKIQALTIQHAKLGLALTFDVDPEQIEITIKW